MEPPNQPRPIRSPPHAQDSGHAAEPVYSDDGVDLTLIRWMLSLTPPERLRVLQSTVSSIARLRNARAGA